MAKKQTKQTKPRAKPKGRPPAKLSAPPQDAEQDDPRLARAMSLAWVEQCEEPWQPSPWETAASFEAFSIYRALGPKRSLAQAWVYYARKRKLTGKSYSSTFCEWSRDHYWPERCAAWDVRVFQIQGTEQQTALKHCQGQLISALPYLVGIAIDRAVQGDTKLIIELLDRTGVRLDAGDQKEGGASLVDALRNALGAKGVPK